MEITGKIIQVLEPVSGTSKAGREWKKREYVMEVPNGSFEPRKVFFNFFGNAADQFVLEGGKEYKVSFDIESREFNGRWYTDIRAWRAEPADASSAAPQATAPAPTFTPQNDPFAGTPIGVNDSVAEDSASITDDLPF